MAIGNWNIIMFIIIPIIISVSFIVYKIKKPLKNKGSKFGCIKLNYIHSKPHELLRIIITCIDIFLVFIFVK